MITASSLAGFCAAHAIWCVSDCEGDPFIPMFAYVDEDGNHQLERLPSENLEQSVAIGKERLETNAEDANDAVLLYDARLDLNGTKVDTVVAEIRAYFSPGSRFIIGIPYTPSLNGKFAVHKPKILAWDDCEDFDIEAVIQAFFSGVDDHGKGSEIWKNCLDESI